MNVINYCESWMMLINPLRDIETQRKHWFIQDGPMVSTYTEATSMFLENYQDEIHSQNYKDLLSEECGILLNQLYEKVKNFKLDADRILKYDYEEAFFKDPKWLDVIALAQTTYETIGHYIEEVKNA